MVNNRNFIDDIRVVPAFINVIKLNDHSFVNGMAAYKSSSRAITRSLVNDLGVSHALTNN